MDAAGVAGSEAPGSIWKVHGALVLVQCGYAGSYVLSKVALTTGVNPIVLALYRDLIALCALAPVAYFAERGRRRSLDLATIAMLAILGIIGVFASQLLLLFGLKLATASLSCVVSITVPILVFFFSAVIGLDDINWRRFDGQAKVGGLLSAVVGAVFMALYKGPAILGVLSRRLHSGRGPELQLHENGTSPFSILKLNIETWQIGVILLFLTGMCASIYITLQVPFLKSYPAPISQTALAYFFGVLSIALVGLITVQDRSDWVMHEPAVIISILYGGIISSAANYSSKAWALKKVGPMLVASYTPLQPFVTSFLAVIFLGESLHLGSVLGFVLIIAGLYAISWGKIKSRRLATLSVGDGATPDGISTIQVVSNLEEPLLG